MLACANSLAFVDRTVLTLLVEPIKADLHVSDTSMGLLSGFGFAVLYAAVGVPVARLADRGNRRNIIAIAVLVWSATTAACGLAWNYFSLLAARAGTGAGEGALSPAAQSMLADYFPKERLPAALGLYSTGIYIGNGAALVLGGAVTAAATSMGTLHLSLLGEVKPWQIVFFVAGAPGLLLAALLLRVREPPRHGECAVALPRMPLSEVWGAFIKRRVAYLSIMGAIALLVMQGNGSGAWIPAFFVRKFGWNAGQIGAGYGIVVLLFGTSGALLGGFVANRLRHRRIADANVLASLAGVALTAPFAVLFPLASKPEWSLVGLAGMNFFAGFPFAGAYAALQELTPNRMRAQVVAVLLLSINLIGGGFGPTLVALLTDFVFHDEGALPQALSLSAVLTLPVAVALLLVLLRSASRQRGQE